MEYNNPSVLLAEIGWSDDGQLNDDGRIEYLRDHLKQALDAIRRDECNLKAFTGERFMFSDYRGCVRPISIQHFLFMNSLVSNR